MLLASAANAGADVFRVLEDDRDAMQSRVDIIQQAHSEIDAVYFLARNDRITMTALAVLREARRRGVPRVRLVVDAAFQHIPAPVLAHLADEGVEVRVYHPLTLLHPSWLFHRMHEKLVVVDDKRYITGGRNLDAAYFGLTPKHLFIDRDVYVDGPSAAAADAHFDELWSGSEVRPLHVHVSDEEKANAAKILDNAAASLDGFVQLNTGRDWSAGQRDVPGVHYLHDPLKKSEGPKLSVRLAEVMEAARSSIVIESPYVIPSKSMRALLRRKLAEGVKVQIVTNSLRSTDGILPYVAYLRYRPLLVRAGVDMREFQGKNTLHSKTLVIDGKVSLVGSYNLDPRSQNLNAESMCIAEDEQTAHELLGLIGRHIAHSVHIGPRPRPAHLGTWARFRTWLARTLVPLLEGQL